MQVAEYPERKCREGVFNDAGLAYTCELSELHPGPHANFSVRSSVEARERYEENNPDWRDHIGSALDEV